MEREVCKKNKYTCTVVTAYHVVYLLHIFLVAAPYRVALHHPLVEFECLQVSPRIEIQVVLRHIQPVL